MPFESQRTFKIWDYNISHRQLLLRSPQAPGIHTNIDIAFWRVAYIEISSILDGVAMCPASLGEVDRVERRWGGKCEPGTMHKITSANISYYVAASGYEVLENSMDIFESSLTYFSRDMPPEKRGNVLARSTP